FGHFRVRASVAKFDRHATGADRRPENERVGLTKGADESLKKDGHHVSPEYAAPKGGVDSSQTTGPKTKAGGAIVPKKEGHGLPEGVRVGDIVVKLG
ncbi:hypothetical protein A2U01_0074376, partial [Trifolium medium]|nr:hypothetical protein [Trifolium medium]